LAEIFMVKGEPRLMNMPAEACPESSQEQESRLSDEKGLREKETNCYG
jgi:hypothetical protein